jgi:hypothetical protein
VGRKAASGVAGADRVGGADAGRVPAEQAAGGLVLADLRHARTALGVEGHAGLAQRVGAFGPDGGPRPAAAAGADFPVHALAAAAAAAIITTAGVTAVRGADARAEEAVEPGRALAAPAAATIVPALDATAAVNADARAGLAFLVRSAAPAASPTAVVTATTPATVRGAFAVTAPAAGLSPAAGTAAPTAAIVTAVHPGAVRLAFVPRPERAARRGFHVVDDLARAKRHRNGGDDEHDENLATDRNAHRAPLALHPPAQRGHGR